MELLESVIFVGFYQRRKLYSKVQEVVTNYSFLEWKLGALSMRRNFFIFSFQLAFHW